VGQLAQRGGWCFKLVLLAHSVRDDNVRSRAHDTLWANRARRAPLSCPSASAPRRDRALRIGARGVRSVESEVKELVMSAEMECPIFAPRFETKVALWSSVADIRLSLLIRERLTETFTAEN
jgi:hypothetical protein